MAKKTISATRLVQDVRSGISFREISQRYGISDDQIDFLFGKLVAAGLLKHDELPHKPGSLLQSRTVPSIKCPNCGMFHIKGDVVCRNCVACLEDLHGSETPNSDESTVHDDLGSDEQNIEGIWRCPACNMPQQHQFDECPQCGILVEKFEKLRTEPQTTVSMEQGKEISPLVYFFRQHRVKLIWTACALFFVSFAALGSYWIEQDNAKRRQLEIQKKAEVERAKRLRDQKETQSRGAPRKRYYITGRDGIRQEVTEEEFNRFSQAAEESRNYQESQEMPRRDSSERSYGDKAKEMANRFYLDACLAECINNMPNGPVSGRAGLRYENCERKCRERYSR